MGNAQQVLKDQPQGNISAAALPRLKTLTKVYWAEVADDEDATYLTPSEVEGQRQAQMATQLLAKISIFETALASKTSASPAVDEDDD
jgi:hypothetical protein